MNTLNFAIASPFDTLYRCNALITLDLKNKGPVWADFFQNREAKKPFAKLFTHIRDAFGFAG